MSKHTPGPWMASEYDDCSGYDCMTGGISIGPRGHGPAHLDGASYGQGRCQPIKPDALERMEADARLIAAAPDLLDALVKARKGIKEMTCWEHPDDPAHPWSDCLAQIDAAITKAMGGQ